MPKIKTHRGAAKRLRFTKNGKIKRGKAFKSHILNKKSTKRKKKHTRSERASFAKIRFTSSVLGHTAFTNNSLSFGYHIRRYCLFIIRSVAYYKICFIKNFTTRIFKIYNFLLAPSHSYILPLFFRKYSHNFNILFRVTKDMMGESSK